MFSIDRLDDIWAHENDSASPKVYRSETLERCADQTILRKREETKVSKSCFEQDAFTGWHKVLIWRAGQRKRIKAMFHRRLRRQDKNEISKVLD